MADLKLKDLRYLVAVADTRHFGRAAERSFVSQPTLSAQLKKLEEYLGVQLIERAPKRVALTAAGEEIVERARRILEASDEIVELARGHRDPLAGRLRLALLPTIGPYLLPNVAGEAAQAAAAPRAHAVRVSDRPDAGETAFGRNRCRNPGTPGAAGRPGLARALQGAVHRGHARASPAGAAQQHQGRRPARRNAAAARRRPLPARPGARHLRGHRRAREAGFPRHQPRDAAADGGVRASASRCCRSSPAAAPTATRAASSSSLSRSPCRRAPSAPCGASRARGAPSSSRCASRSRRTRCECRAATCEPCAGRPSPALRRRPRARGHWFAGVAAPRACS